MLHNYWIDPKGKVYKVPLMGHNEWAHEYIQETLPPNEYMKVLHSGLSALGYMITKLNWSKVMHWSIDRPPELIYYDECKPSKIQIRSIVRYAADHGFKIKIEEY